MVHYFCITAEPVTKKNSQQIAVNHKTGKPFVMQAQRYKDYEILATAALQRQKAMYMGTFPVKKACTVKCIFWRSTWRRVDLVNLLEAVDDILVRAGILEDDNFRIIDSHDGSRVRHDSSNPRTEIWIEYESN